MRLRNDDRGATLVEYALLVALILVVSIGAIQRVQDDSGDKLVADEERVGTAEDNAFYASGSTTTTAPVGTTTTTAPTTAMQPSSLVASPAPNNSGNKWIAHVTVTITDSSGNPVTGAEVQGSWTDPNPAVATQCTTTAPSGTCSMQRTDLNDNKPTAQFTITGVTAPGYSWTVGTGSTTVSVSCSPPLNGDCD
ncbi:MAG: Flp family type IVb pilin [Acidimicrobiia bacterium]